MTVEIDLKAEWAPCWNTDITEAKFFIEQVEVVVQTLSVIRSEVGFVSLFVMPWLIG